MYQNESNIKNLVLVFVDCICITIALVVANYIRHGTAFSLPNEDIRFVVLWGICVFVFLVMNLMSHKDINFYTRGPFHELLIVLYNNIIILVGVTMILYFAKLSASSSRLMIVMFVGVDAVLMFFVHQIVKLLMPFVYRRFLESTRLLVVADSNLANSVLTDYVHLGDFTTELIGVVITDKENISDYQGIKVVTTVDKLTEYCQSASLDEVIIAVGDEKTKGILEAMENIAQMGITIHYQVPVPELNGARHKILSKMGRMYTITYANQIVSLGQVILKRLMDIVGGIVGCLIAVIVLVIFGPIIKIQSPGPIFFGQKRVGRNGRIFKMYKFRSMYMDAEERKKELMKQNEMSGLMFKMADDPRITPIGKFMRRTSLDEFPQFYNILMGDMSLVGTRPPTLDEFAKYSPYHKKRLSFRPGLTGMWQVSGRNDISDFEEIVKLDVEYIDNWSLGLDIKILLKTIGVAFKGK